ncbi:MAG: YdeI/OmpD-associated family protein [Candidatus Doudnabacteria bacterium]|nr:YdeI/OmpD-associated family protein [Candidatus Doudnabacteria bacterium]
MKAKDGNPILAFKTSQEFRKWLRINHAKSQGIWIRFYKKASGVKMMNYLEALDEVLCFGWIDSLVNRFDEKSYIQKFTPRKSKSMWSQINRDKVTKLILEKKMMPAGLAVIAAAKEDGRWDNAYASPKSAVAPEDFLTALKKNKKAKAFFQNLSKANSYAIIWRITTAKKIETRKKRINDLIEMLARGEKLH